MGSMAFCITGILMLERTSGTVWLKAVPSGSQPFSVVWPLAAIVIAAHPPPRGAAYGGWRANVYCPVNCPAVTTG
jgi:hypothetical protein